jgi:uncharacterized protein YciI
MTRYFTLLYYVGDNFAARRAPFRDGHVHLVREAHARGELILAGALGDPIDRALLVFRATDRTTAERFARADPYVVNGLVNRWEVQPWAVVIGLQAGDFDPLEGTSAASARVEQ